MPGARGGVGTMQHDISLHAGPVPFLVHRFTEPGLGSVNTWVVEAEDGLIAIDGQRSLSLGRRVAEAVSGLGKPLAAVVLTHPHPDHVGGLAALTALAPDAPVIALRRTAEIIGSDEQGYFAMSREQLGDDFPERLPTPTRAVADGDALGFLGLTLRFSEFRDVEAPCMLVTEVAGSGAVFVADMVEHGMTAFLLEARPEGWLAGLDALERKLTEPATAYPGHGSAGEARTLIAAQRHYLRRFLDLVRRRPEQAVADLRREFPGFVPVAAIPDLLEKNVDALRSR